LGTRGGTRRDAFGNHALALFLVLQVLDGVLTYVGVSTYGVDMEGNPLIAWLMGAMGQGPGLAAAKLAAGSFGVVLHLSAVHKAVAVLAGFYLVVAVIPWAVVLFCL
jgi:hypothetical protein